jgi:hypothetical protein
LPAFLPLSQPFTARRFSFNSIDVSRPGNNWQERPVMSHSLIEVEHTPNELVMEVIDSIK